MMQVRFSSHIIYQLAAKFDLFLSSLSLSLSFFFPFSFYSNLNVCFVLFSLSYSYSYTGWNFWISSSFVFLLLLPLFSMFHAINLGCGWKIASRPFEQRVRNASTEFGKRATKKNDIESTNQWHRRAY